MKTKAYIAVVLLGVIVVLPGVSVAGDAVLYAQLRQKLCTATHNVFECDRVVEAYQLQHGLGRYAARKGKSLTIQLKSKTVVLQDKEYADDVAADDVILYSYIDYLPSVGLHVIEIAYYEGTATLVIQHESGEKAYPSGFPVVSPDRQRFVATSWGQPSNFNPTDIQIWRIQKGKMVREWWSGELEEWGPKGAQWLDANRIRIEKVCLNDSADDVPCGTVDVVRQGGKWQLIE